ncbi:hypothetical protein [Deinococcus roseus]|nr:hypothetical protein [Deinococcus roseus]
MNLSELTEKDTLDLAQQLTDLEMQVLSDLKGIRSYFEKRATQYGQDSILYRSSISKTAQPNFQKVETRLTLACHLFGIAHPREYNLARKGSPLCGLDFSEAIRKRVLGETPEHIQLVREALMQARMSDKVLDWILKEALQ